MSSAADVSVVMPCFNASGTLDEAVESILAGTWTSFELIAVDDGSTDDTGKTLQEWAKRDRRVRPVLRDHAGLIGALNAGLEAAEAPLIARMDADDRCHPDRLHDQVTALRANPEWAVVGSLVSNFPQEKTREGFNYYIEWLNGLVRPEDIAREIFVESPLAHPSIMMRWEWISRMGGYEEHGWPEDYDLWLRMHLAGASFGKVPRVLLQWRDHRNRSIRMDSRYSVENFLRAKAHYLMRGPLKDRKSLIVWGAGQMGRRLSKHLVRESAPLLAFVDIDPRKIGRQKRGRPVIEREALPDLWEELEAPVLIAAVGSRGARGLIRSYLEGIGLRETVDWWAAA
jgi:glycosyltransferase involved in cell wall biosynthesis